MVVSSVVINIILTLTATFLLVGFNKALGASTPVDGGDRPPMVSRPTSIPPIRVAPVRDLAFASPGCRAFAAASRAIAFTNGLGTSNPLLLSNSRVLYSRGKGFAGAVSLGCNRGAFGFAIGNASGAFIVCEHCIVVGSCAPRATRALSTNNGLGIAIATEANTSIATGLGKAAIALDRGAMANSKFSIFGNDFAVPGNRFASGGLNGVTFGNSRNKCSRDFGSRGVAYGQRSVIISDGPTMAPDNKDCVSINSNVVYRVATFRTRAFSKGNGASGSGPCGGCLPRNAMSCYGNRAAGIIAGNGARRLVAVHYNGGMCGRGIEDPCGSFARISGRCANRLPSRGRLDVSSFDVSNGRAILALSAS